MKILAIETSCDETAISIIEIKKSFFKGPQFKILAETVMSQVNIHKEFGGVFPAVAKREHTKNLLPVLEKTLKKCGMAEPMKEPPKKIFNLEIPPPERVQKVLEKEPVLAVELIKFTSQHSIPKIDAIAVTQGPGLEPALWTGLNFAKALSLLWWKPLIPVNHMEGHIFSVLAKEKGKFSNFYSQCPMLALLLSGGHTELVLIPEFLKYKKIGQTRDDAVGEAFDKVARMLELPYPGGPEISKLAQKCKLKDEKFKLPRPMIGTDDFDFSFSGLKTAVLYKIKELGKLNSNTKEQIAREFEEAVIDVLFKKTKKAIKKYKIKTLIIGGGVAANNKIKESFKKLEKEIYGFNVLVPDNKYSGDNATMIAIAGYFRYKNKDFIDPDKVGKLKADGNMSL